MKLTSELQFQGTKSEEELNLLPGQQDVKFSDLTTGPKFQGATFRQQTPGSILHGVSSVEMTPVLGLQESEVAKVPPGPQGMKQVYEGPWAHVTWAQVQPWVTAADCENP